MDASKSGDILHFAEIIQNVLEVEGNGFTPTQYKQFWGNLNNAIANTSLVSVLIARLLNLDSGDKSPSFVEFVKKVTSDSELSIPSTSKNSQDAPHFAHFKNLLNKWVLLLGEKTKQDMVDELLKMLNTSYLDANDGIIGLVDQCSNIEFSPNFDFSMDQLEIAQLSSAFINTYLRDSLVHNQGNRTKLIFDTILLFLKHPLLSEKRMLSLLHMLKHYLIKCPFSKGEELEGALSVVKSYYLWPKPYGDAARDVLQLLTIEMKSPCAALRRRILEENPELVKGFRKTGRERTVYLLYDHAHDDARALHELIKSHSVVDVNSHQLQINLLANILANSLKVEIDAMKLEYLSKEEAVKYYQAAVQILNEAVLMKQADAENHRRKALQTLYDDIAVGVEKHVKAAIGVSKAKPLGLPPLNFQFIPVTCDNWTPTKEEQNTVTKQRIPKRAAMDLLTNIFGQYAPFADAKKYSPIIYYHSTNCSKPVIKVGIIGGDATIHNVITSYIALKASAPRSFEGLLVEFFVIPVESTLLGGYISRYDGWYARHVYCLCRAALKIAPGISHGNSNHGNAHSENSATPKAKSWTNSDFDRTIEQINKLTGEKSALGNHGNSNLSNIRQRSLMLNSSSGEQGIFQDLKQLYSDSATNPPLLPGYVLRTELENLFREAKYTLESMVYLCECWNNEGVLVGSVPFFQRAELGLRAYARLIQKQNDMSELVPLHVVQQHKSFKYSAQSVNIKYTHCNVFGIQRTTLPIDSKAYLALVLANIALPSDKAVPPNPTKPWLEMYLYDSDKKYKTNKILENTPSSCLHVSSVEIESESSKKGGFHVLLDNVLYGPFFRIRISGAVAESGEPFTVPINTFFPLDLPS